MTGDTAWLNKKDWRDFCEYEESPNQAIANQHLAVLCTYPLAACSAAEILDVVQTHQFTVAKRHASWEVIDSEGLSDDVEFSAGAWSDHELVIVSIVVPVLVAMAVIMFVFIVIVEIPVAITIPVMVVLNSTSLPGEGDLPGRALCSSPHLIL